MTSSLPRRGFLAGAAGFAILGSRKAFSFATREARIAVDATKPIGVIRPELHGHFAEHLGSCIYGGLWVGKNSPIPNINGYRKDAVEALKAVGVPVLRWPGGCFADDYHWRDGIGPAAKRPKSVNAHWGQYTEDNSFGTDEFIGLSKLIGAEPYLAGNVGSGTPNELRDWVEYCNYPSGSTLSDMRAANGSPKPFEVKYWGIGNENWGCGGNMKPQEYATEYRRFATFVKIGPTPQFLIACGPGGHNLDWTRGFFDSVSPRTPIHGYAMHFYSRGRDFATKFTVDSMNEQLSTFAILEKAIGEQRALMDKYDPSRKIELLIDEWGVWDRMVPEEEKNHGRLWQQITMRSAIAAGLGLNVFHRNADKVKMGNIAQIVNVLHCLLLTDKERSVRTSTYHVYDLMKAHRSKNAVPVENAGASPLGFSVSASMDAGGLVVTFVNPQHDSGVNVNCSLNGARAAGGTARILYDSDINACNTFDHPDRLTPRSHPVKASGSSIQMELPPLSVATAEVRLG